MILTVSIVVRKDVSDEAVRHVFCGAGYRFLHSRKNGLLKKDDLRKKCKFTHKVTKMLTHKFLEEGISFYIDVAEFLLQNNSHDQAQFIRIMTWQLKNEDLHPHRTSCVLLRKSSTFYYGKSTSKKCCFMLTV